MMDILQIAALVVSGWIAGAESGSWACVHPVINKLQPEQQIIFQKGLLKTFGRIMPVMMPLNLILTISVLVNSENVSSEVYALRLVSAIIFGVCTVTTIIFNVPVNIQTGQWGNDYNDQWKRKRQVWRFFQGFRSVGFIIGFILLAIASVLQ